MPITLDQLPVELIATILSYLDLSSLVNVIGVSKLLANVCSDALLNPWRSPIQRALTNYISNPDAHTHDNDNDNDDSDSDHDDEWPMGDNRTLEHLSCYTMVPKNNWIDILARAPSSLILFHEIPWMPEHMWKEAFLRRFLPSWARWKKNQSWKQTFLT
jgi:hypothetical protein